MQDHCYQDSFTCRTRRQGSRNLGKVRSFAKKTYSPARQAGRGLLSKPRGPAVSFLGPARPPDRGRQTAATGKGQCFVLIVSGHPGNDMFARHYRDRIARFHKYFTQHVRVVAANITVLSGNDAFKEPWSPARPRLEKILAALAELSKKVKPEDQFILVLLGHGATSEDSCTLMVPGPDIEVATIAEALNRIAARNQVVLNFASNSGDTIARLSRVGRAVVTASSPGQVNDSTISPSFSCRRWKPAPAMTATKSSPLLPGEGRGVRGNVERPADLLATYNWAVLHTAKSGPSARKAAQERTRANRRVNPRLDRGGQAVGRDFQAAFAVPTFRPTAASCPRPTPNSPTPRSKVWSPTTGSGGCIGRARSRRLLPRRPWPRKSHRALSVKGYQPLKGAAPTEVGFFARQIMLGSSQLLPAEVEKDQDRGKGEEG